MPPSGVLIWTPLLAAPFVGSSLAVVIKQQCAHGSFATFVCPTCGTSVRLLDFLPFSGLSAARPRCTHCPGASGWFQPAVALATSTVAVIGILAARTPPSAWINCALGWALLTLAWIDASCFVLPDLLTLPLVLAGLGVTLATVPDAAFWHALGAAAGYLALRSIALAYRALRRREGLGGGDAKLLSAAGAWLGIAALPSLVMTAATTALACACLAAIAGRSIRATTAVPFGPFLAAAFWLLWLYGRAWHLT
ncbi:MAG TPA: A24 family peptidase [Acetobacteraceae bacterium]|nr:A24 family peptidase [Acetobacteraceae bacterium]